MARCKPPDNLDPTDDSDAPDLPRRRSVTLRGVIPSTNFSGNPPTSANPLKRALPLRPKVKPPLKREANDGRYSLQEDQIMQPAGQPEADEEDDFEESSDHPRNTLLGIRPENNVPPPATEKSPQIGSTMRPLPMGKPPESDDTPVVTVEEIDEGDSMDGAEDSDRTTETDLFTADSLRTTEKADKSNRERKVSMPSMKTPNFTDKDNPSTQELHAPKSRQDVFAFFAGGFNAMRNEKIEFDNEASELELLRDLTRLQALITINYCRLSGEEHYLPFLKVDSKGKLIIEVVASWKSTLQGLAGRVNEMIEMVGYISSLPPEIQEKYSMVNDTLKLFFLYLEAVIDADSFEKPDFTQLSSCSDAAFDGISSIAFEASPELVEACKDQVYAEFESEYSWLKDRVWLEDENATNKTQLDYGVDFKIRCIKLIDEKVGTMNIALMDLSRNEQPKETRDTIFANQDRAAEFDKALTWVKRGDTMAKITRRQDPISQAFDEIITQQ